MGHWILIGVIANHFLGAAVCAALDTEDKVFYLWYRSAPSPWWLRGLLCFGVLQMWPVMAYFMMEYRRQEREYQQEKDDGRD